ncbi:MAG: hypothetical protein QGH20_05325, partial [Candidatus Latescibacteria bacterium]|nr:hypothetical protein [Candidatus Latescibacterota bacterium]
GYDQEKEYVAEAAQKGFVTLQTMFMPNMTVHGGVGDRDKVHIQPRPKPEECVGKPGGIYVSFYNSDGDAASVVHGMQSGNWVAPDRGKFKFGWGFLPMTAKLMPAMMDYYHETRTENDCLFGPSSGAGYTYSRMWPEHLRSTYYKDTLQLLRQTGQNGCNMVNWFLQDWWREAEDDEGVRREQSELEELTGLVCGLGGSPYAKSYLDGPVPKIHCVDIANVGRDNIANVLKLAEECPTRPLFVFLFAQISVGIWEQLESEMPLLEEHPEIEIVSMDEFLLTVRDATDRGLLGSELYETNEAMAERWLKQPGRHRLPIAEKVADELASVAHSDPEERRRHLAVAGWTDLVSRTLEDVAGNKEKFLTYFLGRSLAFSEDEEADALLYSAFTLAWHVVRAAIETQGIYANHRTQCLDDFVRTCGNIADVSVIKELFAAWDEWENGTPPLETIVGWCDGLAAATRELHDALGPNESEAAYESWPPRSI